MILQGGSEKVREAGGILAGGHSIADADVKYGLSVMGVVHPDRIFTNNGCQEGDWLLLTKPLGVGIVCTAGRIGEASPQAMEEAVRSMTALNKYASEIVRKYRVHGCTDVTGFGFLGAFKGNAGRKVFRRGLSWADTIYPGSLGLRGRISADRRRDSGTGTMWEKASVSKRRLLRWRSFCLIPRLPAACW